MLFQHRQRDSSQFIELDRGRKGTSIYILLSLNGKNVIEIITVFVIYGIVYGRMTYAQSVLQWRLDGFPITPSSFSQSRISKVVKVCYFYFRGGVYNYAFNQFGVYVLHFRSVYGGIEVTRGE